MRQIFLLVALCAGVLAAQPSPRAQGGLSIETLMSAPFPTELVASPAGGRFAWIASASGVQNLWVAEPPGYAGRAVTTYTADDGQWLSQPAWLELAMSLSMGRGSAVSTALARPPRRLRRIHQPPVFLTRFDLSYHLQALCGLQPWVQCACGRAREVATLAKSLHLCAVFRSDQIRDDV